MKKILVKGKDKNNLVSYTDGIIRDLEDDKNGEYYLIENHLGEGNKVDNYKFMYSDKHIYIHDLQKGERLNNIYNSILQEALVGSEDNARIDNDCFKALCEAFSTEELAELSGLENYTLEEIDFVIDSIFQNKEIYYDGKDTYKYEK